VAEQRLGFEVTRAGGWDTPKRFEIGWLRFDKPGVYLVTLRTTAGKPWHAVNVRNVKIARRP
jgi:hypothetical protein